MGVGIEKDGGHEPSSAAVIPSMRAWSRIFRLTLEHMVPYSGFQSRGHPVTRPTILHAGRFIYSQGKISSSIAILDHSVYKKSSVMVVELCHKEHKERRS